MRTYLTITALAAGLIFPAAPASACECAPSSFTPAASAENIARAAYIFDGTVQDIRTVPKDHVLRDPDFGKPVPPHENEIFAPATITPGTFYKGEAPGKALTVYADTRTSCGTSAEALQAQEFFVVYEYLGDLVLAGQCGGHIEDAHKQALENGSYEPPVEPPPEAPSEPSTE